ncbi:hypothetical protein [Catellatospora citrea]|uniref:Uncharacterized protein n=1 Tax=Catellatospora citrea TaxID=53366 RepID=A0A8J3KRS8_9ACTN|nr:hypothetical protein [Catellatospora citrea]RKE12298.1 hypothetical protein C8E86_7236 [Catellatospora citrea]GIG00805.1 hypothetical protein Cci01nite_58980 [Catellatospora citrea]
MSTLYLARVLGHEPVVVVECVTVHPDAGLPPHAADQESRDAARRFVLRLLADGDEAGDDEDMEQALARRDAADDGGFVAEAVPGVRRVRVLDIGFDDAFWQEHRDQWWATAEVVPGVPVREWLAQPSDSCPYQVAVFEAVLRPGVLRRPRREAFASTAYW